MKTTVTTKDSYQGREVESLTITKADGGFTVECRLAPKAGGKSAEMEYYRPPKPTVFTDGAAMLAHAGKKLGISPKSKHKET